MRQNSCAHFLPQLIGINKFTEGFINCYIADIEDDSEPFTHIYVLMHKDSDLLDIYPFTISKKEVDEGNLYKVKVGERFISDLELFYKGKYSHLSTDAKEIMVSSSGVYPENSLCYHVLYKSQRRKEFIENLIGEPLLPEEELMSILDLNKNIYAYRSVQRGCEEGIKS